MTLKTIKQKLRAGQLVRTLALARVVHPVLVELIGLAGDFDGFWLDQEHAGVTVAEITTTSIAARANRMDCFVRVAPTGYSTVTQCLEAGAGGVMGAQIHSAEQAREFTSWARFAPEGTRGLNTSGRDANYTHKPAAQFADEANREVMVAIQIETLGALDQVDEIAALDGVDVLFIGPADLSLALSIVGQFHDERLWDAISSVAEACARHGKHWGAVVPDPKFADRAIELGCRLPTFGNDSAILRRGLDAIKTAFAHQFDS